MAKQSLPKNTDEYIQQFDPNMRTILERLGRFRVELRTYLPPKSTHKTPLLIGQSMLTFEFNKLTDKIGMSLNSEDVPFV